MSYLKVYLSLWDILNLDQPPQYFFMHSSETFRWSSNKYLKKCPLHFSSFRAQFRIENNDVQR